MELNEKIAYVLLGCVIGFILGYIVRSLRDIKEELDEVEECVRECSKLRKENAEDKDVNEHGFMRFPLVQDVAILLAVVFTVWASFSSQKASNAVEETQAELARISVCNQQYLSKTIEALNQRTTYSTEQAQSNVDLQKAQSSFLAVVLQDPPQSESERRAALEKYFDTLTDFVEISAKSVIKVEGNPFPTNEELDECLNPS